MAPLAFRGAPDRRLGRPERAHNLRMVAAKAADHIKRRDRDGAQRETGIALKRGFEHADRIAGQPIIVGDRAIERRGGLRSAGEFEPLLVPGHFQSFAGHHSARGSPPEPGLALGEGIQIGAPFGPRGGMMNGPTISVAANRWISNRKAS